MDIFRPRAIPALIAALCALCAAAADCSSLDGTYRYESLPVRGEPPHYLSDLVMGPERRKLFRVESRSAATRLDSTELKQRPKVTHLASTATVTYAAGGTSLRFIDAAGKPIADAGIDATGQWSCRDGRLERRSERTAGLGEAVRTERLEETLERNSAGELVHGETVTVIDPPGGKPKRTGTRFPAAP